jgi:hypothetical protein
MIFLREIERFITHKNLFIGLHTFFDTKLKAPKPLLFKIHFIERQILCYSSRDLEHEK